MSPRRSRSAAARSRWRRRRQGLGERPSDTSAAQPSGGTAVVGAPSFVTTLDQTVAFNGAASGSGTQPARCWSTIPTNRAPQEDAPRSRRRPLPPDGEQGRPLVHVHDPVRHALLAAVKPAGHRADLQAHDRARHQPAPARSARSDLRRGCRRRSCVLRRQGPPHRRGRGAGRPADDPPDPPGTRPAGPARDLAVLRGPHRHAEPARLRPDPFRRPVLRRLGDAGTKLRPAPQSELPRRPSAPAAADRDRRRRHHTRSSRSKRRSSTTRSAGTSPPGKARDSNAFTARTAPLPGAGGNAYFDEPHVHSRLPRPEHQAPALRERTHAPRGQLRHRPKRARGERRQLLHRRGARPDEHTARHAGLPRRPRLPARPRPRKRTTPRRQRPPRRRALLRPRSRQPACRPDHQEQPRRDRDRRPRPLHARRPAVDTHIPPERTLGHLHRRLRRQLQRPRRVHQRTRNRRRLQLHALPRPRAQPEDPRRLAPLRLRAAPRPTPGSTWHSRETPCPGSTSPTRSNRTSSPPASAASSTSRWSAWISAPSASGPATTRSLPRAPSRSALAAPDIRGGVLVCPARK